MIATLDDDLISAEHKRRQAFEALINYIDRPDLEPPDIRLHRRLADDLTEVLSQACSLPCWRNTRSRSRSKSFSLIDCISVGVDRMQRNSVLKELDPIPQFKATAKLGKFLETWFSQSFSPSGRSRLGRLFPPPANFRCLVQSLLIAPLLNIACIAQAAASRRQEVAVHKEKVEHEPEEVA